MKKLYSAVTTAIALALVSTAASAEGSIDVGGMASDMIDNVQSDLGTIAPLVVGVIGSVLALIVGVKLVKRLANRI